MSPPLPVVFLGGAEGAWQVERIAPVVGAGLAHVERVAVHVGAWSAPSAAEWALRGVTGHKRYVEKREQLALSAAEAPLDRPDATCAALIPITKSAAWWDLAQDERRAIFEERSRHTAKGLEYLPAIARRLYQSRELGEPFDFLTWFEYAPEHSSAFEDLVAYLRASEEWRYVVHEVDIRLTSIEKRRRP